MSTEKKDSFLQEVARITGYSYGWVRHVACGRKRNPEISACILRLRQKELNQLVKSVEAEATQDFIFRKQTKKRKP